MAVSVNDVKKLRKETLAGMMHCKKALEEADGDFGAAIEFLRVKGLAIADKKSSRETSDGLVIALTDEDGSYGLMIELNSETDFVARSDKFQSLLRNIANVGLKGRFKNIDAFKAANVSGNSVEQEVVKHVAILGENLQLSNFAAVSVETGVISSYVHGEISPNLGKMVAIVALASSGDKATLKELGKKIAMHVVASKPLAISVEQLSSDVISQERAVIKEQVAAIGKPKEIVEKIMNGKMNKYYSEVVLLKQRFVMDAEVTIAELLDHHSKDSGAEIKLADYKLLVLGGK